MNSLSLSSGLLRRVVWSSSVLVVLVAALLLTVGACRPKPQPHPAPVAETPGGVETVGAPEPEQSAPTVAVAAKPLAALNPEAEYECHWAHEPVEIDGKPDDAAWKNAQVIDQFTLPWLGDNERPARTPTKARLLWDRQYVYFIADMEDSDLYADVEKHDGEVWNNDAFELFFKPARDKTGYYEFEVSPANVILDMFLPSRNSGGYQRFKSDGEFDLKTAVQLRGTLNNWSDKDAGWTVEGRIPWKAFVRTGGRPSPEEVWTFALCRVDFSVDFEGPELSTSAPMNSKPHPDFHHFEDYAPIRFVGPKERAENAPRFGIEKLEPLTTSKVIGSPEPPPPYRLSAEGAYPKVDIKYPIYIAHQPGSDRLLVINQTWAYAPSKLLRMVDDPATDKVEELIDLDGVMYSIAFHPQFEKNGYVYIGRNIPSSSEPRHCQIVRYHIDPKPPYAFDVKSETVIFEWRSDGHNGAAITFGLDGMLYITTGDGTSDSDTWNSGQDLSRPLSKVLRVNVDKPDDGKAYSVPADNPFVGQEGIVPETWAYGLRNPWRIACDEKTGQIWVGNNGQDHFEQIYLIEKGANYGWSIMEGQHPFHPNRKRGPHPISKPIADHPHAEARSLTGGIVYYGSALPGLQGAYLYGDYSTGKIWAIRHDGKKVTYHQEIADSIAQPTCFGTDSKGELLIADHGRGGFYRLEQTPADEPTPEFPRTLSESGLFASVKDHAMQPGIIPYSVNAELWSDGAYKERFIAIPHKEGQEAPIEFTTTRGWGFPEGTVLVKSFALEAEAGKADTRKWIETRFFTKQQNEWIGYSYLWNDEQTDATLVEAGGADRVYEIKDPDAEGGVRKLAWRFPSRTECMVCHSRAANFVLGPQTIQMNKIHDYNGIKVNQLSQLEYLGLFRVNWGSEVHGELHADAEERGLTENERNEWVGEMTATRDQRQAPATTSLLYQAPEAYKSLVDPRDEHADLDLRARSYLHANCAHCHVEAGGGNSQMLLDFAMSPIDMKLFNVPPLHSTFDLPNAKLVATGKPDHSVLLHRMSIRGTGQMPPVATTIPDVAAVNLLRQWIDQANAPKPPPEAPAAASR